MGRKPFGPLRRGIVLCLSLVFVGGSVAAFSALWSERALPRDDVYAACFLGGCLGFIGLALMWIFLDMGYKSRRAVTVGDIVAAAVPHALGLADGDAMDDPGEASFD